MKYEIHCNGRIIAQFVFESDRDTCLDALREAHPDSRFRTIQKDKDDERHS